MGTGMLAEEFAGTGELERSAEAEYECLRAAAAEQGARLAGPDDPLPPAEFEVEFGRYRERLLELKQVGDMLRPLSLRSRREVLAGDELAREIVELFAA